LRLTERNTHSKLLSIVPCSGCTTHGQFHIRRLLPTDISASVTLASFPTKCNRVRLCKSKNQVSTLPHQDAIRVYQQHRWIPIHPWQSPGALVSILHVPHRRHIIDSEPTHLVFRWRSIALARGTSLSLFRARRRTLERPSYGPETDGSCSPSSPLSIQPTDVMDEDNDKVEKDADGTTTL
jgi:hypothetical protein